MEIVLNFLARYGSASGTPWATCAMCVAVVAVSAELPPFARGDVFGSMCTSLNR